MKCVMISIQINMMGKNQHFIDHRKILSKGFWSIIDVKRTKE